jgi:hypothetical protein
MADSDFYAALLALSEADVDFLVVGGLAAVLNGAPVNTFDLDIVHSREPSNVARILQVLETLDEVFRIQPERQQRPNASHLTSSGHLNLITRCGPLDVLGTIGRNLDYRDPDYRDLLPHTIELEIGHGLRVRVLDLETLISLKETLAGEKDLAVLPILRRTLEEKRKAH